MRPELYFDISEADSGGSLFRSRDAQGQTSFVYHHSTYDADRDEVRVFKTPYASFALFWAQLVRTREWWYLHPLFVHPEVRSFVQQQLKDVDWTVQGDEKWQESHRRQWKKVLTDPAGYYQPPLQ